MMHLALCCRGPRGGTPTWPRIAVTRWSRPRPSSPASRPAGTVGLAWTGAGWRWQPSASSADTAQRGERGRNQLVNRCTSAGGLDGTLFVMWRQARQPPTASSASARRAAACWSTPSRRGAARRELGLRRPHAGATQDLPALWTTPYGYALRQIALGSGLALGSVELAAPAARSAASPRRRGSGRPGGAVAAGSSCWPSNLGTCRSEALSIGRGRSGETLLDPNPLTTPMPCTLNRERSLKIILTGWCAVIVRFAASFSWPERRPQQWRPSEPNERYDPQVLPPRSREKASAEHGCDATVRHQNDALPRTCPSVKVITKSVIAKTVQAGGCRPSRPVR